MRNNLKMFNRKTAFRCLLLSVLFALTFLLSACSGGGNYVITKYWNYDNGELTGAGERTYDSRGNLTRISSTDANGAPRGSYTVYEYDTQGNPVSGGIYDENGNRVVRAAFSWNAAMKQLTMEFYDEKDELFQTDVRLYNDAGGVLQSETTNHRTGVYRKTVYKLQDDKHVEASVVYDQNGDIQRVSKSTLDQYGNWLKSEYRERGDSAWTTSAERQITCDRHGNMITMTYPDNPEFVINYEWIETDSFFWWFISIPYPSNY